MAHPIITAPIAPSSPTFSPRALSPRPQEDRNPDADRRSEATDYGDMSPAPIWRGVADAGRRIATLDSLETHVEEFWATWWSVEESLRGDWEGGRSKGRGEGMGFVGVTKEERRATLPQCFSLYRVWRPLIVMAAQPQPAIDPRLTRLRPDPVFVPQAPSSKGNSVGTKKTSWSDIDWWRSSPEDGQQCSLSSSSSSPSPAPAPQTVTKSASNIRLALLLLHKWFTNPVNDLAAIVNRTFATGLTARECARLVLSARAERSREFVQVFERDGLGRGWKLERVLWGLERSAVDAGVRLVKRGGVRRR